MLLERPTIWTPPPPPHTASSCTSPKSPSPQAPRWMCLGCGGKVGWGSGKACFKCSRWGALRRVLLYIALYTLCFEGMLVLHTAACRGPCGHRIFQSKFVSMGAALIPSLLPSALASYTNHDRKESRGMGCHPDLQMYKESFELSS